jgi:hypothetical protein
MTKLFPLSQIPYRARKIEARERAKWPTRAMALDAATIAIMAAPGCYGGAEAPKYGFVLTLDAAEALSEVQTNMPGGTSHRRLDYSDGYPSSEALDDYLEAIARGTAIAEALAAYETARKSAA